MHRPGLPRARGRGRGAQRRPAPIERLTVHGDRRAPRVGDRRPWTTPADHHRALRRRGVHAAPARPRPRSRRGRAQLRADRGRGGRPALAGPGRVPGAEEPGEPPSRGRPDARAVALRVHEHASVDEESPARSTSATTCPRAAVDLRGQRAGQHPPRPRRHPRRLPQRRPRAAPVRVRQRGPPHAAEGPAVEREALQGRHDHRGQGVRRPAPPAGRDRVGGGRRLRPRRGRPATPCGRAPRDADPRSPTSAARRR